MHIIALEVPLKISFLHIFLTLWYVVPRPTRILFQQWVLDQSHSGSFDPPFLFIVALHWIFLWSGLKSCALDTQEAGHANLYYNLFVVMNVCVAVKKKKKRAWLCLFFFTHGWRSCSCARLEIRHSYFLTLLLCLQWQICSQVIVRLMSCVWHMKRELIFFFYLFERSYCVKFETTSGVYWLMQASFRSPYF